MRSTDNINSTTDSCRKRKGRVQQFFIGLQTACPSNRVGKRTRHGGAHCNNLRTQEAEAGDSLSELDTSLGYRARLRLKNKPGQNNNGTKTSAPHRRPLKKMLRPHAWWRLTPQGKWRVQGRFKRLRANSLGAAGGRRRQVDAPGPSPRRTRSGSLQDTPKPVSRPAHYLAKTSRGDVGAPLPAAARKCKTVPRLSGGFH